MRIAVDFDGVLHDRANPLPGKRMGPPIKGALEAIEELLAEGHYVFIHTSMALDGPGEAAVYRWLADWDFPDMYVVAKELADVYIDDRAIHFNGDWGDALYDMQHRDEGDNEIRERA